ncbi:MAG: lipid-A-disaccharide synthase N-terminal domain-containing protein [archaeon]
MTDPLVTFLGFVAGTLTTVAFLPQVIKSHKSKKTGDISTGWIAITVVGVFLWLVYGILAQDLPIIFANTISLVLALTIVFLKLRHG